MNPEQTNFISFSPAELDEYHRRFGNGRTASARFDIVPENPFRNRETPSGQFDIFRWRAQDGVTNGT